MNTAPMQEIKVQLGFSVPEAQAVIDYRQFIPAQASCAVMAANVMA